MPWAPDAGMIYEHLHRYLFAAGLVAGRRVLDLASGEGYGADILAASAREVVGLEIDPDAVAHARRAYDRPNLRFETGSMLDLTSFTDDSFDAVTCFEALEHITEHDDLIDGIDRVLGDDGLVIMSTPDRHVHTDAMHQDNPFHLRELDADELATLLGSRFAHVSLWGQRFMTGSLMLPMDGTGGNVRGIAVRYQNGRWAHSDPIASTYVIGVGSRLPLHDKSFTSWLNDEDHRVAGRRPEPGEGTPADRSGGGDRLDALQLALERFAQDASLAVAARDRALDERDGLRREIEALEGHCARLESDLAAITESKGWRTVLGVRSVAQRVRQLARGRD